MMKIWRGLSELLKNLQTVMAIKPLSAETECFRKRVKDSTIPLADKL